MLFGDLEGSSLELRAGQDGRRVIRGRFPYNSLATLSDGGRNGGRPRKEQFAPGAFSHSIENADQDIALLSGHDFSRPLASKKTGSLLFTDSAEALTFDATIVPEVAATSYAQDLFGLIAAGLSIGLSPGFRIPPPSAVPPDRAEKIEEENPSLGRALIRTILQAILFEMSIVTRPAYADAQVEARNWSIDHPPRRKRILLP
ncbi:MAG: HK97 family phage prohead protease [Bauldia sp.]|nr:HK97 family phage prohead protease [Bauldia sp.]